MTTSQPLQDAQNAACTLLATATPHADLTNWLNGKGPDKAIAAMMVSAAAKKPQKVGKRLAKPLSGLFGPPKVVKWEKAEKFVYGAAFSAAPENTVLKSQTAENANALFQTDLYLRSSGEHTGINAVTVAAIAEPALTQIFALRNVQSGDDASALSRLALTQARVFSTGLEAAEITPETPKRFLLPFGEDALEVDNFPIDRTDNGERKTGQILVIRRLLPGSELKEDDAARLSSLAQAMTKSGHPGREAFGELVAANARSRF